LAHRRDISAAHENIFNRRENILCICEGKAKTTKDFLSKSSFVCGNDNKRLPFKISDEK
jgi:hypothetical protein